MSIYLNDYSLHAFSAGAFIFCSSYAIRHWQASNFGNVSTSQKIRHRVLAIFEFIPVVGAVISLVELAFAKLRKDHKIVEIKDISQSTLSDQAKKIAVISTKKFNPDGKHQIVTIQITEEQNKALTQQIYGKDDKERLDCLKQFLNDKIDLFELDDILFIPTPSSPSVQKPGSPSLPRRNSVRINPLNGNVQVLNSPNEVFEGNSKHGEII